MNDRVLGVIGGMGSYATLNFFKTILDTFPAEKEWERPHVIVDNCCTLPSRVRAILYKEKVEELIQGLIFSMDKLIAFGVNDIIVCCNTCHYFLDSVFERRPDLKHYVINILECAKDFCIKNEVKKVFLIATEGTIETEIYDMFFSDSVQVEKPTEYELKKIRSFIEAVKQNKIDETVQKNFADFINNINCTEIVLGCTEMPIIYSQIKDNIFNKNIIDPLSCALSRFKERYLGIEI